MGAAPAGTRDRWVLLSGGVGGAKLALGLDRALPPGALTVVANSGDDFTHLGLAVSPDLDTLLYTLGGVVNPDTGWGRRDETWHFMEALDALGGETWFRLGDRDLALHVERTRRLAAGETLSQVTAAVAARLGLATRIVPMSDAPAPTRVVTAEGTLGFQDYFVRRRAEPVARGFGYGGAAVVAAPGALAALADPRLAGVILAPSNPWLSVLPILAVPGIAAALRAARVPVVAVSPVVGGAALKGPTAKIMAELGVPVTPAGVARQYAGLAAGLVLDEVDAAHAGEVEALGLRAATAQTVMRTLEDRVALARAVLGFAWRLAP
jgi:LPPG:FO 2-phospho-L-lactate transferase